MITSKTKINVFEIFSSLRYSFGDSPLEKISKNVDFSLWGKKCIVLPKWTFFLVLAHWAPDYFMCAFIDFQQQQPFIKSLLCGSGVGHHHHLMLLCVVFGVNWTDVNSSSMMIWKLWLLTSSNLLLWLATNIRILCLYSMHTVDWNLWKSSRYLHPFWIMHLTT